MHLKLLTYSVILYSKINLLFLSSGTNAEPTQMPKDILENTNAYFPIRSFKKERYYTSKYRFTCMCGCTKFSLVKKTVCQAR